jgi:CRP/FNR family transcriptional regulator
MTSLAVRFGRIGAGRGAPNMGRRMTQPGPSTVEALCAAGAPSAAADALARVGETFSAPAGRVLFRPGDVCIGYIAPTKGAIRVSLTAASGRQVTLYRVTPGDLCLQTFQCLVSGGPYGAEGVVEEDLSGVLVRPGAFASLVHECPAFRDFLLQRVAARFGLLMEALEAVAFTPTPQRLAAALLRYPLDRAVAQTHAALAAEIGASREAVSRQLEAWRAQGLVHLARGEIQILKRDALSRLRSGDL